MARQLQRRFVESAPQIDIRRACREMGKAALSGGTVIVRSSAGEQSVELARCDRPVFGGQRVYFRCGRCSRRACILYFARGGWACRRCHRLAHWTEALAPRQRRVRWLVRLRERMGQPAGGSAVGPLPDKPKWMRWHTYERLAADLTRREREHFASPIAPTVLARMARSFS